MATAPKIASSSTRDDGFLAIVTPAYNEEGCVGDVVAQLLRLLDQIHAKDGTPGKLLVVNDGSKDRTLEILRACAARDARVVVVDKPNGGHGHSVLRGYHEALAQGASWVFQVDSDDQFEIEDFQLLWEKRHQSHFTLGFRLERSDPAHRLVITRILRAFVRFGFGCRVRDANVPFRLISSPFLRAMLEALAGSPFAPNIFLSIMAASALKNAGGIGEIGVRHRARSTGKISIVRWRLIRVCMQTARELFEFRRDLPRITSQLAGVAAAPPERNNANLLAS